MAEARYFRFEAFADAPSAQAALEATYPPGSPAQPALQRLADMGAQCRAIGDAAFACRYLEHDEPLAGACWHVVLFVAADRSIERACISRSLLGA